MLVEMVDHQFFERKSKNKTTTLAGIDTQATAKIDNSHGKFMATSAEDLIMLDSGADIASFNAFEENGPLRKSMGVYSTNPVGRSKQHCASAFLQRR